MLKINIIAVLIILSLSACNLFKKDKQSDAQAHKLEIVKQSWVLKEIPAIDKNVKLIRANLKLSKDGTTAQGYWFCNSMTANVAKLNRQEIKFINISSTEMSCDQVGIENQCLKLILKVDHWTIKNEELHLKRKNETLFIYVPAYE